MHRFGEQDAKSGNPEVSDRIGGDVGPNSMTPLR